MPLCRRGAERPQAAPFQPQPASLTYPLWRRLLVKQQPVGVLVRVAAHDAVAAVRDEGQRGGGGKGNGVGNDVGLQPPTVDDPFGVVPDEQALQKYLRQAGVQPGEHIVHPGTYAFARGDDERHAGTGCCRHGRLHPRGQLLCWVKQRAVDVGDDEVDGGRLEIGGGRAGMVGSCGGVAAAVAAVGRTRGWPAERYSSGARVPV